MAFFEGCPVGWPGGRGGFGSREGLGWRVQARPEPQFQRGGKGSGGGLGHGLCVLAKRGQGQNLNSGKRGQREVRAGSKNFGSRGGGVGEGRSKFRNLCVFVVSDAIRSTVAFF